MADYIKSHQRIFKNQRDRFKDQEERFRNPDEEWNQQFPGNRGEDIYGYGEDHGLSRPKYQLTYRPNPYWHNEPYEDFGNYGRGGYYGNTYEQERYNRERSGINAGNPDNYRNLGDRHLDKRRGSSWRDERLARPGYSLDEERRYQHNKGKGPRNYQRSDQRIWEEICHRLMDDFFVDASDIEVSVNESEVTLSGTVDSRGAKRRAEDISESVFGIKNVENKLRVKS